MNGMEIDIYSEMKAAIKDALSEWFDENRKQLEDPRIPRAESNTNQLFTVKQFCAKHHFITEGALRQKIFCREYNKFNTCIVNVGRRVLIKEKETLEWFSNPPAEAAWTYDKNKYKPR